ncbi:MAG: HIT domain-containing protein [Candidatus Moraniibacteriota bacterium]
MIKEFDFYCEEAISGKTPIDKLYESDQVLAFYHTRPSYATHIVIIPKKHILDLPSFSDDDLEILNEIMKVARDLSKSLDRSAGVKLCTNVGAFQETPHTHFHLVVGKKLK